VNYFHPAIEDLHRVPATVHWYPVRVLD